MTTRPSAGHCVALSKQVRHAHRGGRVSAWTSRPASWSCCSVPPAAARPRRCGMIAGFLTRRRRYPPGRTQHRCACRRTSATWASCSRATRCSRICRLARNIAFGLEMRRMAAGDRSARVAGNAAPGAAGAICRAPAAAVFRRPAATRGPGPRAGNPSAPAAAGRAAVQPRRRPAPGHGARDPPAATRPRHHHHHGDARPDRGDGDGRPAGGDAATEGAADRPARRLALRPATPFVARFIGGSNVVQGRMRRHDLRLADGPRDRAGRRVSPRRRCSLAVRPDSIRARRAGHGGCARRGHGRAVHLAWRRRSNIWSRGLGPDIAILARGPGLGPDATPRHKRRHARGPALGCGRRRVCSMPTTARSRRVHACDTRTREDQTMPKNPLSCPTLPAARCLAGALLAAPALLAPRAR